jgi:hypothetical protein
VKEQFFHSFPCASANGVTVCHAVILVYVPHVSVVVLHNGRFQSVSMLVTEITFCWIKVHICQHVLISFVFSYYRCQVTPHSSLGHPVSV